VDTEEYRKKIEEEVLEIIEAKLIEGEMNAQRAREIARYVLESLHPHMNLDGIYKAVQTFDDHFGELVAVVVPVANEYENHIRKVVTTHVSQLIKEKKINEANKLLSHAIDKKIKVAG